MDFLFPVDAVFEEKMIVTQKDTAQSYGSGLLEVFATPAMIALMEHTSMRCVSGNLPEGWGTVGVEVNIQHVKASPVGAELTCKATLTNVEGRKLTFKIEVFENETVVGFGTHVRFIVDNKKFMEKLKQ